MVSPSAHLQEQQNSDPYVKDSNPHSVDIRQPAETEKESEQAGVTKKFMTG